MTDPTITSTNPSPLLHRSLRANAAFSLFSGAAMLIAANPLAALMGIGDARLLTGAGLNLLAFAALLVWLASRVPINLPLAMAVVVADLLWVAGSAALLPMGFFSGAGNWIVACIADVVLVFAYLQYLGIRRLRRPLRRPDWAEAG